MPDRSPAPSSPAPALPGAVVLLSGGMDSAVTLAVARRDGHACHALSFDYGQRHRHELAAAPRLARALGAASHRVIAIDLRGVGGSALTDAIDVPKTGAGPGVPVTYVPARNLLFLAVALGLAEVLGARDLYIGANAVDYSGYPDCRPAFLEAFQRCANLATKAGVEHAPHEPHEPHFRVRAPLVDLPKPAIVRLGLELGVDFAMTHSCYDPVTLGEKALACRRCDACRIRSRGFADAGVPDPTAYADDGTEPAR